MMKQKRTKLTLLIFNDWERLYIFRNHYSEEWLVVKNSGFQFSMKFLCFAGKRWLCFLVFIRRAAVDDFREILGLRAEAEWLMNDLYALVWFYNSWFDNALFLVYAHGVIGDAGENCVFGKLRARLPVFRDGPILTGGS